MIFILIKNYISILSIIDYKNIEINLILHGNTQYSIAYYLLST